MIALNALNGGVQVLTDIGDHHIHVGACEAADELGECQWNEYASQAARPLLGRRISSHGSILPGSAALLITPWG